MHSVSVPSGLLTTDPWNPETRPGSSFTAAVTYRCHRLNQIHNCCFDPRPLGRNQIGENVEGGKKKLLKEGHRPHHPTPRISNWCAVCNALHFSTERHEHWSLFNILIQPILTLSKGKGERERMEELVSRTGQGTSPPSSRPHGFNLMGHSVGSCNVKGSMLGKRSHTSRTLRLWKCWTSNIFTATPPLRVGKI